jgi:16S rRNA (uracil1498-N3)-methyltransferase
MKLEIVDSLENFLDTYPNAKALNFSENRLSNIENIDSIVIGCEGGFTNNEIKLFNNSIIGLDTLLILKSESAICAMASKILV